MFSVVSYENAVARLYELGHELGKGTPRKFDLEHMRVLLRALENPERRFACVLIAGTNGKGSTAATLATIAQAAGHHTGLYTSPHLLRVNERIRIDGDPISDPEFTAAYDRVEEVAGRLIERGELPWHPSFFETLTAMALEYFAMTRVDLAVLEVGMGGRLDATNVVEPCISVITDISLDHEKFLGNTIAEIAREKAGILHANGTVVLLPQHPQANDVLGKAIVERNARAISAVPYMPPVSPNGEAATSNSYELEVMGREIRIESPLVGRHQFRNIALAIAAAVELNRCGFAITPEAIERGVHETHWPGRFQVIDGSPTFVLDVAHNPAGAWALRSALSERFPDRSLVFVFGAMRDKAITEIASILFGVADLVVATQAAGHNPRVASPEEIRAAAARTGAEIVCEADVRCALEHAKRAAQPGAIVVVTGSIYVVGEALQAFGIAV